MKQEIDTILGLVANQFAQYNAGTRTYASAPWWNDVLTNEQNLADLMAGSLENIGFYVTRKWCTGSGSAAKVPYVWVRPYGENGITSGKTNQGAYVNYLFSGDGTEVYLAIQLSTNPFPGRDAIQLACKALRDVTSREIEEIKTSLAGRLQNTDFQLEVVGATQAPAKYGISCPYWIKYDSGNIPVADILEDDLSEMFRLYNAIADARMIQPLEDIMTDLTTQGQVNGSQITLSGNNIEIPKLQAMLRNFSILPYNFQINELNTQPSALEFTHQEWMTLSSHSNYLRISNREGDEILCWDYKINKTNDLQELERLVLCHKTVILEGPPGVGKTYFYNQLVKSGNFEQCELITFNPATENSDFIGGLTPVLDTTATPPTLKFDGMEGIFVRMLRASLNHKVLLWIDEVNRGNVAKIFGEFIGLLGTDKPYSISIKNIGLPNNVLRQTDYNLDNFHVVGTLNTADQSISTIDLAIRRRFQFVRMYDDFSVIDSSKLAVYRSDPSKVLALPRINAILDRYGSDAVLGHSYLYELEEAYAKNPNLTLSVWEYSILPNLIEILMREQIDKDVQDQINKELRPIGFNIINSGNGYGAMKIIVPVGQTGDAIPHRGNDEILEKSEAVLNWQNNMILEGVPGVGKTWMVRKLWNRLGIQTAADIQTYTRTVTFGPATEPEDFVGGLFPQPGSSPPTFEYIAGVLMELAIAANDEPDPDKKYVLFIDEINRGNLPKVMGALMTIIETSKRYDSTAAATRAWTSQPPSPPTSPDDEAEYRVALMHENGNTIYFGLPENLYIIGAMNTSDRSVIHLDGALRRRFSFMRIDTMLSENGLDDLVQLLASADISGYWNENNLQDCRDIFDKFASLNEELFKIIGPDGVLGHSYLFDASWCHSPLDLFVEEWKITHPGSTLSATQIEKITKLFQKIGKNEFSRNEYRELITGTPTSLVRSDLVRNLGGSPVKYRLDLNIEAYDQAFWQGFWDQFSYAILPQLSDTLNAFAINEAQAAGIIEKLDEITTLFIQKHDALEAQKRYLRPPPEIGSAREWRVE